MAKIQQKQLISLLPELLCCWKISALIRPSMFIASKYHHRIVIRFLCDQTFKSTASVAWWSHLTDSLVLILWQLHLVICLLILVVELSLIFCFGNSLFLVHDSDDIIASGGGDDAICIFTEEKSTIVCCPNIYVFMIPVLIWCV